MNADKIGKLIFELRTEKNLTQKELAKKINVTDKAVSKWERGQGCPDVSLLPILSNVLGVDIESILNGQLDKNTKDGGNMRNISFYVCEDCGNIITVTGKPDIRCCGRHLKPLTPQKYEISENQTEIKKIHHFNVETIEDDYYITFNHEMTKEHFITFVAYVTYDKVLLNKLYREQSGEVRFPKFYGKGKFYFCCNKDGLFVL